MVPTNVIRDSAKATFKYTSTPEIMEYTANNARIFAENTSKATTRSGSEGPFMNLTMVNTKHKHNMATDIDNVIEIMLIGLLLKFFFQNHF